MPSQFPATSAAPVSHFKNRKQRLNTYLHTKSWKFRPYSITVTITKKRKMLVYNFSLVDFPKILSLCNLARPSPSVFSHPKYICTYLGHTYSHQLHEARDLGAIHISQINRRIFDRRHRCKKLPQRGWLRQKVILLVVKRGW